jgi:integrase
MKNAISSAKCKQPKDPVSVTKCKHPRYTHRVRFPGPDSKRLDRFFTNETDALTFANEQRKETGELGTNIGSVSNDELTALSFWRAFAKEAAPAPPSLVLVLRDYKTSWLASNASVTVTDAIEKFLAHHEAEGSSARHLASLKSRLGRFSADNGPLIVSTITSSIFTDWLNGLRATRADKEGGRLTPVTRSNLSRSLRSFFNFALDRGWITSNPVPEPKRSKNKAVKLATRRAPAIMFPADVARFMGAVQATASRLVPFWALKFFAGIRDAEAGRMDWNMIDLAAGEIHLPAAVSKTGEARTMKIEPNLDAWIRPYAATSGPIAPGDMARRYGYKRTLAGLATKDDEGKIIKRFVFPSNAARHSFGTYHLFHFRNAGETALQLGHKSNPAMLHEHYKNPAAAKHAKAFWSIFPTSPQNVIPIDQSSTDAETQPEQQKQKASQ